MSDLDAMIRAIVRDEIARALIDRPANDEYLSTEAAGKVADVSPGTIRRWVREGKIPEHRAGRVVRVLRSELEEFLCEGARDRGETMSPEQLARRDFR